MYIENLGGGDALIIDRLYVTVTGESQITYTISNDGGRVCLSTDGTDDGCSGSTVSGLVNLDTQTVDYTADPAYDCSM